MDINYFTNKSKGEVLIDLKKYNLKFKIPKTYLFYVKDWKKDKNEIFLKIQQKFYRTKIALRSSSKLEDNENSSNAGRYLSFLNVDIKNKKKIYSCIEKIINSYGNNLRKKDQIIIQEMILNINCSGVVFTKNLDNGADYYVINYDDITGKTNTVTSGTGNYSNRILFIYKNFKNQIRSPRFKKLILFVKDLEKKIKNESIDLEFAITKNLKIYILQARSISTKKNWNILNRKKIDKLLNREEIKIVNLLSHNKKFYGKNNILGNMPDWNPVEIIGKLPNRLSFSLYKYLITDNIWAKARSKMGYKDYTKNNLMYEVCGQPYIDTRLSLNSFLPKKLSKNISQKIITSGIEMLKKYPHFHDKIEFNISAPSYNFSSEKNIKRLFKKDLNSKEKNSFIYNLKLLTKNFLEQTGHYSQLNCINKIEKLNYEFKNIKKVDISDLDYLLNKCRDVGTFCFSILARHGFVAKSFLNSLLEKKILTAKKIENLEQSLNTITFDLLNDSYRVNLNKDEKKQFMKKYGHLRPGTYDITSKRYDQMKNFKYNSTKPKKKIFKINSRQKQIINDLLKKSKFNLNSDQFFEYIKTSLIKREYSKFVFTKYLSLILEIIAEFANQKKISREEISEIDINFFLKKKYKKLTKSKILYLYNKNSQIKKINELIKLPSLILDKSNLFIAPYQVNLPNFITKKKTEGEGIQLKMNEPSKKLDNKIVFIENADPGYDWIFSYKVKGLVTKYGGINSHMSIRCAELSLPAVIGCGEQIYSELIKKKNIHIDCSNSLIYSLN